MITLYKLAQKIGVAYPTIYKRFKNSELYELVEKDETGKLLINEELAGVVRSWYTKPTLNLGIKPEVKVNVNLLDENTELKKKNEELEKRVRELTDELILLNRQTVELTKSAHILLGMEQQNKSKMIGSNTKKSFWNIFKKKQ